MHSPTLLPATMAIILHCTISSPPLSPALSTPRCPSPALPKRHIATYRSALVVRTELCTPPSFTRKKIYNTALTAVLTLVPPSPGNNNTAFRTPPTASCDQISPRVVLRASENKPLKILSTRAISRLSARVKAFPCPLCCCKRTSHPHQTHACCYRSLPQAPSPPRPACSPAFASPRFLTIMSQLRRSPRSNTPQLPRCVSIHALNCRRKRKCPCATPQSPCVTMLHNAHSKPCRRKLPTRAYDTTMEVQRDR